MDRWLAQEAKLAAQGRAQAKGRAARARIAASPSRAVRGTYNTEQALTMSANSIEDGLNRLPMGVTDQSRGGATRPYADGMQRRRGSFDAPMAEYAVPGQPTGWRKNTPAAGGGMRRVGK
jgi:hypothetical protein